MGSVKNLSCYFPILTRVLLARCRKWEKIPFLEPRAIGYRMGPKIGIFSQCRRNAKDIPVRWYWLKWVNLCRTVDQRALSIYHTRLSFSRLAERSVSDGNLCGLETREGPWARTPPSSPPRGGGIISTTLTLFGPPFYSISSRFSRGKSGV